MPLSNTVSQNASQKQNIVGSQSQQGLFESLVGQEGLHVFQSKYILFCSSGLLSWPCPTDISIYHLKKHYLFHLWLFHCAIILCILICQWHDLVSLEIMFWTRMASIPTDNHVHGVTCQDVLEAQERPACLWTLAIASFTSKPTKLCILLVSWLETLQLWISLSKFFLYLCEVCA